jgi:hypothetical protein
MKAKRKKTEKKREIEWKEEKIGALALIPS